LFTVVFIPKMYVREASRTIKECHGYPIRSSDVKASIVS
jgi:hypothetical protein